LGGEMGHLWYLTSVIGRLICGDGVFGVYCESLQGYEFYIHRERGDKIMI
jgi:hypothetical protein